jgi:A/G-specific adenine glycosylase
VSSRTPATLGDSLLEWGLPRLRELPWRARRDRWAVLVSEVMAQQTQVSRVIPKWTRFMECYPTPVECAAAPLADLLRLWSGLGYPRRCRYLHEAATIVVARHGGVVPGTFEELRSLPGVGPYTARAVMAFADGVDVAAVDTNVARVIARVVGEVMTAKQLQAAADSLLPPGMAWEWNQVLMDFGAEVCTARNPACDACPIHRHCRWDDGDDPAVATALTSKPQPRFEGSDRQARGRLLAALAMRNVRRTEVGAVMMIGADTARADRLVDSLVRDRLVVVDGEWCRLP